MEKRYLTRRQVGEIFGISPKWLANLNSQGKGPRYLKLGKKVLYRVQDVEKWIEENALKVKTE